MPKTRVRVLHADDSPAEAELLRQTLSSEPDIEHVGSVHRLEDLPSEVMRLTPDVVVLDFLIGGRDPLLCRTAGAKVAARRRRARDWHHRIHLISFARALDHHGLIGP